MIARMNLAQRIRPTAGLGGRTSAASAESGVSSQRSYRACSSMNQTRLLKAQSSRHVNIVGTVRASEGYVLFDSGDLSGDSVPQKAENERVAAVEKTRSLEVKPIADEVLTEPAANPNFVQEDAVLAASTFPIAPDVLIAKAKAWLAFATTTGEHDVDEMAEGFEFCAPVVGPLPKDAFLEALATFDIKTGVPDICGNFYHFRVDPFEPNRVWFTSRTTGTHTGTLAKAYKPTGIKIESPPQAMSIRFDEEGKIIEYTIGYSMDRRIGNTGGLGGIFGIFYAIGSPLPFPEGKPWKMSKRYRFFQLLGKISAMFKK